MARSISMIAPLMLLGLFGCQPGAIGYGASDIPSSNVTAGEPDGAGEQQEKADRGKSEEDQADKAQAAGKKDEKKEKMSERLELSDKEWRERLSREQFRVLRMKGTEQPFRNKYDKHFEKGTYACAGCEYELFSSDTKFNSGCGWPAFFAAKAKDRVNLTPDYSHGMVRTEVTCARCDGHLGHIFNDAPHTPSGQRYCINSVSLKFIPAGKGKDRAKDEGKDRAKDEGKDKVEK